MSVRAIGFDLDGTLVVPQRDRKALLAEALSAVDGPPISRREYLAAHRGHHSGEQSTADSNTDGTDPREDTREPIFASLLADYPDDDTDPAALAEAYRTAINDAIEPLDGAVGLVSRLRSSYRVGLLTNGPSVAQRSKLRRLGWTDRFDAVVVTGELPAGKPDPIAFETLCSELDVRPAETVYVGDLPTEDVEGAARAGLRPIQVLFPDGPDPHPEAVATIDRDRLVAELPELIESIADAE